MSKIRPRRLAEATVRLLAANGLIAQDSEEDEEEDSEDESDGYSE
jgi:hypothetical protein